MAFWDTRSQAIGNYHRVPQLDQLGYQFNREFKLVKKFNGARFTFTNQRDYDVLGEAVTEDIYKRLEDLGLR